MSDKEIALELTRICIAHRSECLKVGKIDFTTCRTSEVYDTYDTFLYHLHDDKLHHDK